ncbi:MAG: hypothetical protein QXU32_10285 [Nitrososphaerales archaeon]
MHYSRIHRILVESEGMIAGIITATNLARHLRWGKTSDEIREEILTAGERDAT